MEFFSLGPILFNYFFPGNLEETKCINFADDAKGQYNQHIQMQRYHSASKQVEGTARDYFHEIQETKSCI